MQEQDVKTTQDRLNLLAIFYLIMGVLGMLGSLLGLVVIQVQKAMFSGSGGLKLDNDFDSMFATIQALMQVFMLYGLISSALALLCAYFLKQQKHRLFCMLVACSMVFSFPFGTILAVFTLIVLTNAHAKALFDPQMRLN